MCVHFYISNLSEEVLKSNFRQYGQMEKQRWEQSERRRKEVRRSGKKKRGEKKEDAGARKGRKVAIHCVFPMICGSGGSKSWLAKAADAEPAGQMRDEKLREARFQVKFTKHTMLGPLLQVEMSKKCAPLWCEAHFQLKSVKN